MNETTETAQDILPLGELPEGRIGVLDRKAFDAITRKNLTAQVLNIGHEKGWDGVLDFLHGQGIEVSLTDSSTWAQPPEASLPAHPKYYLKWDQSEFMRIGEQAKDKRNKRIFGIVPRTHPGATGNALPFFASVRDAASFLNVCTGTIREMIKRGELAAVKPEGRHMRIPRPALIDYLEKNICHAQEKAPASSVSTEKKTGMSEMDAAHNLRQELRIGRALNAR